MRAIPSDAEVERILRESAGISVAGRASESVSELVYRGLTVLEHLSAFARLPDGYDAEDGQVHGLPGPLMGNETHSRQ